MGEKKKGNITNGNIRTQMAILDETDSGLDIDATRIIFEGVKKLEKDENRSYC